MAAGVRRLRQDVTLQTILEGIKSDARAVFDNPTSEPERIIEAHSAIRAVGTLLNAFDAIEADERISTERSSNDG